MSAEEDEEINYLCLKGQKLPLLYGTGLPLLYGTGTTFALRDKKFALRKKINN